MAAPVALAFRIAPDLSALKANLAEATSEIETTKSALQKMANAFDGSKTIASANAMVVAINNLGGASALTASEQAKVNTTVSAALEKYAALGQQAPPALQDLASATAQLGESTEKSDNIFSGFISHYLEARVIWEAAKTAYRDLVQFLESSVEAYAQAEAAERRLTVAVQTQGLAIPGLAESYLQLGEAFEQTTAFSHTAIDSAIALFVQLGNVGPSMMGKALQAATDLASGLGMDLNAAVELLSRAAEGQTQSFTRYGIVLDQAKVKAEGFGYVLDAIEQKVGGQATAELDTYAGKVKQIGNAWDDTKEAIGKAIVEDPLVVAALQEVTAALNAHKNATDQSGQSWTQWVLNTLPVVGEFNRLRDAAEQATKAKQDFDASVAGATKAIPGLPAANLPSGSFLSDLDAQSHAFAQQQIADDEQVAAAAKKSAEAIQALHESLFGDDVIKKANEYAQALGGVSNIAKLTADSHKTLADAMQHALDVFVAEGHTIPANLAAIASALGVMTPDITMVDSLTASILKLGAVSEKVYSALPTEGTVPNIAMTALTSGADKLPGIKLDLSKVLAIPDAPETFAQMLIGDPAKFGESLSSTVLHAVEGGGNPIEAIGSKVGGDFGKNIANEAGGSIEKFFTSNFSGSLGKALGSAFTAAIPIVGSLLGPALQGLSSVFDHFFGSAGRDAVTTFASSMGGFDALHQKLDLLGADGEQLWINLTQGVGHNNPQQAKAAIDAINKALGDQANLLNELNADGTPTYQTLIQLRQKYNLTASEMGAAFQTQQIDSQFQSLLQDMTMLSKGGTDVTAAMFDASGALSGLGTTMQTDIQQAITAGVAIPANLKAAAQALIDQGDLLDANGQKITDINQLTFGATIQTDLETLNETLQKFIDTLNGKGGLTDALKAVPTHVDVDIAEHIRQVDGSGGGTVPGAATGGIVTRGKVIPFPTSYLDVGGFVPRGSDTVPAMLTPGEVVLNAAQQQALAGAMAGETGGGDIHIYIDGRDVSATAVQRVKRTAARGGLRTRAGAGRSY